MNPTRMAEKPMFPTHWSNPSDGEPDAVKVARPVRRGGMAQTSRSSPAIGGAVPIQCIPAIAPGDDRSERLEDGHPSLGTEERLFIGAWRRLNAHLANRLTWTGILYLFLKFPLGIASFVIVVVLVAFTGALLAAPFYFSVDDGIDMGIWQVDALWEALILTITGIPLAIISLHMMNGAAFLHGRLARLMLGKL